jgi:hypothetical protein
MSNPLIRAVVRTKLLMTGRASATNSISKVRDQYLKLASNLSLQEGTTAVSIPPMIGVDPEMQNWSFFQILEHNAIVNRMIAQTVEKLARGEDSTPERPINHKTDVMPHEVALSGSEQIEAFRESVDDYLSMIGTLPNLRGTAETSHPVFGLFDAHKWHCMFGFHLGLHLKQAEKVISLLPC